MAFQSQTSLSDEELEPEVLAEYKELLSKERRSTIIQEDEIAVLKLELSTTSAETQTLEEQREELQTEVEKWQLRTLEVERLNRDLRAQLALIATSAPRMEETQPTISAVQLEKLRQKSEEMLLELTESQSDRSETLSRMEQMADELSSQTRECQWHQSRVKVMESETKRMRKLVTMLWTEKQDAEDETEMLKREMEKSSPEVRERTSVHIPSDTLTILSADSLLLDDVFEPEDDGDDADTVFMRGTSFELLPSMPRNRSTPSSLGPMDLISATASVSPQTDTRHFTRMGTEIALLPTETTLVDSHVEGAVVEDTEVEVLTEMLMVAEERVRVLETDLIETRRATEERKELRESAKIDELADGSDDDEESFEESKGRLLKRTGTGLVGFDASEAQADCVVCSFRLW